MEILNSIILGITQGITEFLPISSSGHIAIFENILNYKITLAEELILNIGTLLALIFFTRSEIINIIKEVLNPKLLNSENSTKVFGVNISKKFLLLFLGSIPVSLFAFLFKSFLEKEVSSLGLIALMMILVGVFMIVAEKIGSKSKTIDKLTMKDILVIGFTQVLALLRGTSRSGVTISTGILLGFKREDAVNISFLIGLPALLGSCIVGLIDLSNESLSGSAYIPLLFGFVASFISGLIAIKVLLSFVKKHSLIVFSIYRIIVGFVILIYVVTR